MYDKIHYKKKKKKTQVFTTDIFLLAIILGLNVKLKNKTIKFN